jgi:hypothetical protein
VLWPRRDILLPQKQTRAERAGSADTEIMKLTPWINVLFEILTVSQLSNNLTETDSELPHKSEIGLCPGLYKYGKDPHTLFLKDAFQHYPPYTTMYYAYKFVFSFHIFNCYPVCTFLLLSVFHTCLIQVVLLIL